MTWAVIKNWAEFQHYKDRSPPWLKLHRKLLDDRTFQMLPIASKALAPMLWLLAAENMEGRVDIDQDELVFRLRWKPTDIASALPPLIEKGFLILDSAALALCGQHATPEAETETDKKQKALSGLPPLGFRFTDFWSAYPNKKGRQEAEKAWKRLKLDQIADRIIENVRQRQKSDPDWQRGAIPHGSTYVNQARWEDAIAPDAPITPIPTAGSSPILPADELKRREADALAEAKRVYPEMFGAQH